MADDTFHLAQFNISRLKAPLDDPSLKEFVDFLDPVNAFAEQSPGFVWRPHGRRRCGGVIPAIAVRDPMMITNLTVWTDLESLRVFAYETVHRYFLQSRRKMVRPPCRQASGPMVDPCRAASDAGGG